MSDAIAVRNSGDHRTRYANSVQVQTTLWDFALLFGMLERDQVTGETAVEEFQTVYVSPQQAKAMHELLGAQLRHYERTFGAVSLKTITPAGAGSPTQ